MYDKCSIYFLGTESWFSVAYFICELYADSTKIDSIFRILQCICMFDKSHFESRFLIRNPNSLFESRFVLNESLVPNLVLSTTFLLSFDL